MAMGPDSCQGVLAIAIRPKKEGNYRFFSFFAPRAVVAKQKKRPQSHANRPFGGQKKNSLVRASQNKKRQWSGGRTRGPTPSPGTRDCSPQKRSNASVPTRKQDTHSPPLFPWNCLGIACLFCNMGNNGGECDGIPEDQNGVVPPCIIQLWKRCTNLQKRSWYRDEPGPRETGCHSFVRILGYFARTTKNPSRFFFFFFFFSCSLEPCVHPLLFFSFSGMKVKDSGYNRQAQSNSIPSASLLPFFWCLPGNSNVKCFFYVR